MKKINVAVLGATGMVGQKFISLLDGHPWFNVTTVAASPRSKGKAYGEVVKGKWTQTNDIPINATNLILQDVEADAQSIAHKVDLVFSAINLDKEKIKKIEELYASLGVAVISNNSAHRWTEDVPMIIPEINPDHLAMIDTQRKNRNWTTGFITTKPNCSIQSYVPILKALEVSSPSQVSVTTLQAISGAGKTFETWPEMVDNVNPYISGEEEKSEREPLKILGDVSDGHFKLNEDINISATCIRVAVKDGHMANISIKFQHPILKSQIVEALNKFKNPLAELGLPSAPKQFIKVMSESDRPQTRLDRDYENGMGVTVGRIRKDSILDYKMVCLSHNTIRGAAGGAILLAELAYKKGYIK